jgi:hypothetical protein
MGNMEQQGQPGRDQDQQGQKPYQPGKHEGDRPQPGKDKSPPTRTPDDTGGGTGSQRPDQR